MCPSHWRSGSARNPTGCAISSRGCSRGRGAHGRSAARWRLTDCCSAAWRSLTEPSPPPPVLLVIAGPAGSGKSTLCDRLVAEVPAFTRVVTAPTPARRAGEISGVHYHFFSPDEFKRKIIAGEFFEWAQVHGDKHDRLYGTLKSSVLDPLAEGKSLIISVEVQGGESFRRAARMDPPPA